MVPQAAHRAPGGVVVVAGPRASRVGQRGGVEGALAVHPPSRGKDVSWFCSSTPAAVRWLTAICAKLVWARSVAAALLPDWKV